MGFPLQDEDLWEGVTYKGLGKGKMALMCFSAQNSRNLCDHTHVRHRHPSWSVSPPHAQWKKAIWGHTRWDAENARHSDWCYWIPWLPSKDLQDSLGFKTQQIWLLNFNRYTFWACALSVIWEFWHWVLWIVIIMGEAQTISFLVCCTLWRKYAMCRDRWSDEVMEADQERPQPIQQTPQTADLPRCKCNMRQQWSARSPPRAYCTSSAAREWWQCQKPPL